MSKIDNKHKLIKAKTKYKNTKYTYIHTSHDTVKSKVIIKSNLLLKRSLICSFCVILAGFSLYNVLTINKTNMDLSKKISLLEAANAEQSKMLFEKSNDIQNIIDVLNDAEQNEQVYENKYEQLLTTYVDKLIDNIPVSRSGSTKNKTASSSTNTSFATDVKELREILQLLKEGNENVFTNELEDMEALTSLKDKLDNYLLHLPTFWPVNDAVSDGFGYRTHPIKKTQLFHEGLDFASNYYTPIKAAAAGKVVSAGYISGYGKCVVIEHGNSFSTAYAHCNSFDVKVGDVVSKGQVIAKSGNTGLSTGPHLHFEIRINGQCVDPLLYLEAR